MEGIPTTNNAEIEKEEGMEKEFENFQARIEVLGLSLVIGDQAVRVSDKNWGSEKVLRTFSLSEEGLTAFIANLEQREKLFPKFQELRPRIKALHGSSADSFACTFETEKELETFIDGLKKKEDKMASLKNSPRREVPRPGTMPTSLKDRWSNER